MGGIGYELLRVERLLWFDQFLWGVVVFGRAIIGLSDGYRADEPRAAGASYGKDGWRGNVYERGAGGV
jgi:hypothetical protein